MTAESVELNLIDGDGQLQGNINNNDSMEISKALYEETHRDITWSQIIGGSVGNILEWYHVWEHRVLISNFNLAIYHKTGTISLHSECWRRKSDQIFSRRIPTTTE